MRERGEKEEGREEIEGELKERKRKNEKGEEEAQGREKEVGIRDVVINENKEGGRGNEKG
jgi:hypothetical protein